MIKRLIRLVLVVPIVMILFIILLLAIFVPRVIEIFLGLLTMGTLIVVYSTWAFLMISHKEDNDIN